MSIGDIANEDNIALLDFDWDSCTIQATIYQKGSLSNERSEILPDDVYLDELDIAKRRQGSPIIGYTTKVGDRTLFYSINYEHGECL